MKEKSSAQVIIVEASAGSGKTHALAKHYLKLILRKNTKPSSVRDILAITFTKQAAREMKERILEFLKTIAFDNFKDEDAKREFFKDILSEGEYGLPETRRQAVSVIEYIIRNYNFFQVQTIDSFMNMILAACSFAGGMSARFRIKENYGDYLCYSLDKIIDDALKNEALRRMFDSFIRQYLFIENKTQWLPKKNVLNTLDSLLYHFTVYGRPYKTYEIGKSGIFAQRSGIMDMLRIARSTMPEGTKALLVNALDKLLTGGNDYFDLDIFAKSKTLRSEYFPVKKNTVLPGTVKNLWENYKNALSRLAAEESLSIFNCYAELFCKAQGVFEEYSLKQDAVFLGELNERAGRLIKNSVVTIPELYLRLSSTYKHFLIDEFQDTSVLRWENLSEMVRNALSSGGSLFCVGDKKQAIFRFSGGDAGLGRRIAEELNEFGPETRDLKKNFRSHKQIVEFNNSVFSKSNLANFIESLMPEDESDIKFLGPDDAGYILDVFANVEQKYDPDKPGGYVNVSELQYGTKEEKIDNLKRETVAVAEELSKRHPGGEIAFLCRTNTEVELVSGWLTEALYSVESEKTLDIRNNRTVREITAFLKFLNSPIDNLSFAAFITGGVFCSKTKFSPDTMRDFIFSLRAARKKHERYYIYREFRARFENLWDENIEEFFNTANFLGVYELAASIVEKFGILSSFPKSQGFTMHLLELIKLKEDEYKTLGEFLEYLENEEADEKAFYLNPGSHNSIKVLTIHKSKGLDFDAVVVPFLEISVNDLSASRGRSKLPYAIMQNKNSMSLIKLDRKYAVLSEHIRKVYVSEYRKSIVDELCAVYVAFTRPRKELHVILPVPQKNRTNYAKALFPSVPAVYGSRPAQTEVKAAPEDNIKLNSLNIWMNKISEPVEIQINLLKRSKIKEGAVIHYMLSCLPGNYGGGTENVIDELKMKARQKFPSCGNIESLAHAVERLITDKKLKDIFITKGAEVYNEKEYADAQGGIKRFDRVIVREGEVWIVDYKTSLEDTELYKGQMESYVKIARDVYPDKKTRAFLVSIEKQEIVEL